MAHISKTELPQGIQEQIEMQLRQILHQVAGKPAFEELLTEVELLMLAKRFSIILMLIDEQSYYRIEQVLGASVSTSRRLHQFLIAGQFPLIEKYAANKRRRHQLMQSIEILMRAGLPPRTHVIKKRVK